MTMVSRVNRPIIATQTIRPRMDKPVIYATLEYCVTSPGYDTDIEIILNENHGMNEDQEKKFIDEAVKHPVLQDGYVTPSVTFFLLEDKCISEDYAYRIAALMKKAGICPAYECETVKGKWKDEDNIFAAVYNNLLGSKTRSFKYDIGNFTFSINLGDETLEGRRKGVLGHYKFKNYQPHGLQITKKGRKDYCGGGFKLHELDSVEFAYFNFALQRYAREFVAAANQTMAETTVPIDINKTIISSLDWEKKFRKSYGTQFETEYFPKVVESIKNVADALSRNDKEAYHAILEKIFGLVSIGLKEGGGCHISGDCTGAYHNLLFASGYLAGLSILYESNGKHDNIEKGKKAALEMFDFSVQVLMANRWDIYTKELLINHHTVVYDRNLFCKGLEYGIGDKIMDINSAFNPDPLVIRRWSIKNVI